MSNNRWDSVWCLAHGKCPINIAIRIILIIFANNGIKGKKHQFFNVR